MTKICPACGTRAVDDQSQFCNKCGYPFPEDPKKTVVVRTAPRISDTLPAPAVAEPRTVRTPEKRPVQTGGRPGRSLPFKRFFMRDFIRPVYWLGMIAIILIVFSGITADLSKTAATTNIATQNATIALPADFSGIPIFWIGILVFSILFWRAVCEMCTIQFALYDTPASLKNEYDTATDSLFEDGIPVYSGEATGEMVGCPRCGKVVPADHLRTCAHCGVQGCSSCIRMMGLIKKTLTCRDCFENK